MAIQIIITDAGRAEIINAENTGTAPVLLAEIGLGFGQYSAAPDQTQLQNEFKRLPAISGLVVSADTIHVSAEDQTAEVYTVYEFGIYTDSGTLFAVYSQNLPITEKTADSFLLLALDILFTNVNAGSVTFGSVEFNNPPASTTVKGVVELADNAEALTGTDQQRAVTPAGTHAAFGKFGLGKATGEPIPNANADTISKTGIYSAPNAFTGSPYTGTDVKNSGTLTHNQSSSDGNYATQTFISMTLNEMKIRHKQNNVWSSWDSVFLSSNKTELGQLEYKIPLFTGATLAFGNRYHLASDDTFKLPLLSTLTSGDSIVISKSNYNSPRIEFDDADITAGKKFLVKNSAGELLQWDFIGFDVDTVLTLVYNSTQVEIIL